MTKEAMVDLGTMDTEDWREKVVDTKGLVVRIEKPDVEKLRLFYEAVAAINPELDAVVQFPRGGGTEKWVAVGGTFDHLHAGHRLLLAATAFVAKEKIFVGIAGDDLLKKKKHAELLETFDQRSHHVVEFLQTSRPDLEVDVSTLSNAPPKAATIAEITGLVVSEETLPGAQQLQQMRRDHGIEEPLHLIITGLIGGNTETKLSSTTLREHLASESS